MHKTSSRPVSSPPAHLNGRDQAFPLDYEEDDAADEFVLPGENYAHGRDNLEERVQTTQNRLARLREEAEALEREKQQFEELSRKQKEFMSGRAEMSEKLTRALSHLDRETYEAQKRVEQLLVIKNTFVHHLDVVESLNPEEWNSHDLQHDLNRSLGLISEARDEYVRGSTRVHQLTAAPAPAASPAPAPVVRESAAATAAVAASPAPVSASTLTAGGSGLPLAMNRQTFRFWVFCGLGLSLPLAVVSFVLFVMWLIAR